MTDQQSTKQIIEALLMVAEQPLSVRQLAQLLSSEEQEADPADIRLALQELAADYQQHAFELQKVASGYRLQVRPAFNPWVNKLWEQKPPRYSKALLETLAIIAYRQPITRAEIAEIRGIVVSTAMIKTLLEHEWVKSVGQREVPGRPHLYATTKQFLDHFNLASVQELPTLVPQIDDVVDEVEQSEQTVARIEVREAN